MKNTSLMTLFLFVLSLISPHAIEGQRPGATPGGGTIAYIRGSAEIRLIEPDGTGDRRVWVLPRPDLASTLGLTGLAWRPDGKELAFASSHNAALSWYDSDIYLIRPDGTELRRITNSPDPGEFARFPKGSVKIVVRNDNSSLSDTGNSFFIIYVSGAPEPQSVTLTPGASKTLLFNNVADFGNVPQPVVAIFGEDRWISFGMDIQAGRTSQAGTLSIQGSGLRKFGASGPVWRSDGAQLGYILGSSLWRVPANPTVGSHSEQSLIGGEKPPTVRVYDWGPTPATANQILYGGGLGDYNIYQVTEGSKSTGLKLLQYDANEIALLEDLHWLRDGSGFLFARSQALSGSSLHRYDFATKKSTTVREFEDKTVTRFSQSPDGQWIVLEFGKSVDASEPTTMPELWLMRADGKDLRLLVKNGQSPSWSRAFISR
jgi:dipeptidyl aminopeptidase/acylaminoacyl peptidase